MTSSRPLSHVTVLDLTTFLSGPYATQILGDLGADVIKVETPGGGDPTRAMPPHFVHGDSAYFHSTNRNKRSIVLDLKKPAGRDLLLRLAGRADVLFENFRPGVMDRLGLGEAALLAANPRLVTCSLTGFGHDGPYRDRPAYDMIVQALSGGMSMTGPRDGPPVRSGIPLGDLSAGMFAVIGVLSALSERQQAGKGGRVDIAMLDCQISMLSYQAQYYLVSGQVPGPQGAEHDSIPTYRAFACRGGQRLVVTANTERMWTALCAVLGLPDLPADPRFTTNERRLANRRALWDRLEPAFAAEEAADLLDRLIAAGIPSARISDVGQALADPQVRARAMVVEAHGPDGRTLPMTGNPVRFPGAHPPAYRLAPRHGEHTAEVLGQLLGLDEAALHELAAQGVISAGSRDPATARG